VRRRLAEVIAALPKKQRIPLVLFYLHGYEIAEIAEMTGAKLNTVRGRLRYGRARIRKKVLADPDLRKWVQEETI
jgi:RNA polymerase sigma factor (sigma-70 family)